MKDGPLGWMDKQELGGGAMKIGLYSITFSGIWYRGNPLTLEELIEGRENMVTTA